MATWTFHTRVLSNNALNPSVAIDGQYGSQILIVTAGHAQEIADWLIGLMHSQAKIQLSSIGGQHGLDS